MSEKIHFKGLNGLRAIAAISVVLSHTGLMLDLFGLKKLMGFEIASYGVTMFFSLSGFLITYLLLVEKKQFGKVDVKKFYIRRLLRIWPLYFIYLFAVIGVTAYYNPELLPGSTAWYFLLAANVPFILGTAIPRISHYWSLGVEEQFYLFWPLVIQFTKNALKAVTIFLSLFLLAKIACRLWLMKTGDEMPLLALQVTRFDCMAIGGIGACLFYDKQALFMKVVQNIVVQATGWIILILIACDYFHVASMFDHEIVAVFVVVMIVNVSSNTSSLVRLDFKLFDFLGKISYGIYVIHPLVIFFLGKFIGQAMTGIPPVVRGVLVFVMVLLVTVGLAWLSYEFIEKKFLRLKTRFSKVHSSS